MQETYFEPKGARSFRTLVQTDDGPEVPGSFAVYVHHGHLDHLVGRLMQMCDLIGDIEQRGALKDTIKKISRDWLDDMYEESGYQKFEGPRPGVVAAKIPGRTEVKITGPKAV